MVVGFIGIVGWVWAVDRHSSPPSVGTQFRIRLTLGNGSGPNPVQVPADRGWAVLVAPGFGTGGPGAGDRAHAPPPSAPDRPRGGSVNQRENTGVVSRG